MPKHEMLMWLTAGGGTLAGATMTYLLTRPTLQPATGRAVRGWQRLRSWAPLSFSRRDKSAVVERHARRTALSTTGNAAFDEYREQELTRLEREASEFRTFLDGLRDARDRKEFDAFLNERKASASPA